ncbi:MAG: TetR/AcrR family transcriptional regulator [Bacteroides sp.]|nr:TetR/AcrR family transcriptional regulator [Roseburia sp.]MCM1345618.1 TetR/AcrR family transcriptional regulator [Bacteroides sp.]MCM1421945.1 TetR/AcrR family transcriptional regulator [Bacteroides sp.]
MEEKRAKRPRRTKAEIERLINKAAKDVILKKGFTRTKVLDIIKRAKIEAVTFYLRYRNQEEFYDEFIKEYDYWFHDALNIPQDKLYTPQGYIEIFQRLSDALEKDSVMLELLRWEVNETNGTTRRSAMNREFHTLPIAAAFEKTFSHCPIDIIAISSLLIAGIYYLNLHRDVSPFCGIDVSTVEGRNRLLKAIESLTEQILINEDARRESREKRESLIAERMRQRGFSEEDIAFCLSKENL